MKTCRTCKRELLLTEFFRHRRYADGYNSQCKACHRVGLERVKQEDRPTGLCACGCGETIFLVNKRGTSRTYKSGHCNPPLAERLWAHVTKTESCWLWTGTVNKKGYGTISDTRRSKLVGRCTIRTTHQISWELTNGPIPKGMWVLHHCDVRNCVRPDHLYLGTRRDNVRDAVARNRIKTRRGEDCPTAKLTSAAVRDIRQRFETDPYLGLQKEMAIEYGVSTSVIHLIVHRRAWKHV